MLENKDKEQQKEKEKQAKKQAEKKEETKDKTKISSADLKINRNHNRPEFTAQDTTKWE